MVPMWLACRDEAVVACSEENGRGLGPPDLVWLSKASRGTWATVWGLEILIIVTLIGTLLSSLGLFVLGMTPSTVDSS